MTAVSSFKPHAQSAAVAENQQRAKETWESVFERIIYVAPEREPMLASAKTYFFICQDQFPTIAKLVEVAASFPGWTCIINADIRVSFRLRLAERGLTKGGFHCAISRRFELPEKKLVDLGLDFFAAFPSVWRAIMPHVPKYFRIGHILWDTWMLSAFVNPKALGFHAHCADITPCKAIFHPKHEDRNRPFAITIHEPNDGLMKRVHWPRARVGLDYSLDQMPRGA